MTDTWHFNRDEQFRMKRDKLVRVAADCFNQKGFSGTSLKDVAKQLNVTDAALYYYVKNKEELVNLCYVRAVDLAREALDRAFTEGKTPLERIERYIHNQVHVLCDEDIGPVAVLSEVPSLKSAHKEIIQESIRSHSQRLAQLVEAGVDCGEIAPTNPRFVVAAIMGACNWLPKWYRPDLGIDPNELADSYVKTFCNGLRADP